MKVLLVGPRFHTNQYQMVKTLQEHGHEVFFHVASLGSTEDYSLLKPALHQQSRLSVMIEKILGKGGMNRPRYFPRLFKYWNALSRLKADIVIIRDPYKTFSFIAAVYASILGARVIFYTQENLFRKRSLKVRVKHGLMIRLFKAAWMVPISEKEEKGNGLKHMYYIPLPIPIPVYTRNSEDIQHLRILMIGKYNQQRKNHLLLIHAANVLKEKYRFTLTMVGECTRDKQLLKFREIQETVADLGLTNIIDLKRNVPFNEMGQLYESHHIFVLPAIDEQYGISVTEALGYGLPVICTDTCGARFNITNGNNGFVVRSNSLPELTTALESLISAKSTRDTMSKNAEKYVHENLSGEIFYKRIADLVRRRFDIKLTF